jgi:hypothetical protein
MCVCVLDIADTVFCLFKLATVSSQAVVCFILRIRSEAEYGGVFL